MPIRDARCSIHRRGHRAPESGVERYERRAFLGLLVGSLAFLAGVGRGWARSREVVCVARNVGLLPHNLVVLRTNLAPGKLPTAGSVAKEIGRRGKTPVFGPGRTPRLALD